MKSFLLQELSRLILPLALLLGLALFATAPLWLPVLCLLGRLARRRKQWRVDHGWNRTDREL